MKKNQKGYTVIELVICLAFAGVLLVGVGMLATAAWAVGKYLFGWWG